MEYKDYYKTLGISRNAGEKDIRTAYRKLARQYHPDVNPGNKDADTRFREINEAYQVLSDPEKRGKYDRFGADWERYQQTTAGRREADFDRWFTGGARGPQMDFDVGDVGSFSDFFRTLFGGVGGRRTATATAPNVQLQRGADLEQEVEITLEEAFRGTSRTLQLRSESVCPECGGVGIRQSQLCDTCRGRGTVTQDGRLEVRIPSGVYEGARVRIQSKGEPGAAGGPPGDLYLRVRLRPDPDFELDGADVRVSVPVDLYTCVLGGEVNVRTPSGRTLALTIPPGTNNGRSFRLRGQGMPVFQNPSKRGDLYATVSVRLPAELSDKQKQLFQQLRQMGDSPLHAGGLEG